MPMRRLLITWPVVLVVAALIIWAIAPRTPSARAATPIIVPPLADPADPTEPGVTLTFEQNGRIDTRPARLIALRVPAGQAPSPFLQPGSFTATFAGFINMRLRAEVEFRVESSGPFVLKIADKVVFQGDGTAVMPDLAKLQKGKNPFELTFTSPAPQAGQKPTDAYIRLLWSSNDFPAEPVQPTALSRDATAVALRAAKRLREGRELLATLRCTACHTVPAVAPAPGSAGPMPEMASDAPDLSAAGARLNEEWMAEWIQDPRKHRPDATMPKVLHGEQAPAQAWDLAAYLATLGKPLPANEKPADDEAMTQGGQLFAGLGCIGCHTKPDAENPIDAERKRVPLAYVRVKFKPGALRAWLLDPQKHYKWARMPNFHLTEYEADRLVAYLNKKAPGEPLPVPEKGDAARGKVLFASAGCASCHPIDGVSSTVKAAALADLVSSSDWAKGCVAEDPAKRATAPDFALNPSQRGALVTYAAAKTPGLGEDVPVEFAQRSIKRLNCAACHTRDEVEDAWTALAENELADIAPPEANVENDQPDDPAGKGNRPFYPAHLKGLLGGDKINVGGDQQRPALTWAGEKLRPEWAQAFIAGETTYKPRYWMRARMPGFPTQAAGLARGMALEHGIATVTPPRAEPKPDSVEIGRQLSGRDAGFACITCHSIGDTRAISPFEAPAPNFARLADRMTDDFYFRWMRKPMRYQPGTKMPQFAEGGKTDRKDVLDGDAEKQFDALWQYMLTGTKIVAPE
ncbi:MAG TPA: c-type cytochrome [Tepidisphaeraceae bacterium]|nr:c-type cytochrome [Tepidisphaeraceae bacterium]